MATTYKTSSGIKRPVVVSVPVTRDAGTLAVKDAETTIRRAGGQPMSKEEIKRFNAFKKADV